eukprot:250757-Chlamydomonas_euryale.AAC.21
MDAAASAWMQAHVHGCRHARKEWGGTAACAWLQRRCCVMQPLAKHTSVQTHPSSVEQPHVDLVLLHLLRQHLRVLHGVPHQEHAAKAGTECGLRLRHAHLGAGDLRGGPEAIGPHARGWAGRWSGGRGEPNTPPSFMGQSTDRADTASVYGDFTPSRANTSHDAQHPPQAQTRPKI